MRTSYGYTKDKDWAQYLVDNDLTPKKYRKQLIDSCLLYTSGLLVGATASLSFCCARLSLSESL